MASSALGGRAVNGWSVFAERTDDGPDETPQKFGQLDRVKFHAYPSQPLIGLPFRPFILFRARRKRAFPPPTRAAARRFSVRVPFWLTPRRSRMPARHPRPVRPYAHAVAGHTGRPPAMRPSPALRMVRRKKRTLRTAASGTIVCRGGEVHDAMRLFAAYGLPACPALSALARISRNASARSSRPNTAWPATSTVAPASATRRAVSRLMPPSTSMST